MEKEEIKLKSVLDLLLAFLYAPSEKGHNEPIKGITRLEKLMFLFSTLSKTKIEDLEFEKHYYGPYSAMVYDVSDLAAEYNLIQKIPVKAFKFDLEVVSEESGENREYIFKLTKDGEEIARTLWENLSEEDRIILSELKKRFNNVPLLSLISLIYVKYPEYLERSKLKNKLSLFGIAPDLPSFNRKEIWCER